MNILTFSFAHFSSVLLISLSYYYFCFLLCYYCHFGFHWWLYIIFFSWFPWRNSCVFYANWLRCFDEFVSNRLINNLDRRDSMYLYVNLLPTDRLSGFFCVHFSTWFFIFVSFFFYFCIYFFFRLYVRFHCFLFLRILSTALSAKTI